MELSIKMRSIYPSHPATGTRKTATICVLLMVVALTGSTAFAQTGLTGIFGGGPFYKNAAKNITEIENSGFTEAIVWSVEVNSAGDCIGLSTNLATVRAPKGRILIERYLVRSQEEFKNL